MNWALIFALGAFGIVATFALYRMYRIEKAAEKIHPSLQATVNRAYSKAQQALENSVEAIQIAKDEVPGKPNKPCNSKFRLDGVERTCVKPKYPGHDHPSDA